MAATEAANHSNLMPLQNALALEATRSCNPETFGFSSALPGPDVVIRTFSLLRPWSAGLLLTLIQLVVAVFLLAPDGPLSYRYTSLVQHDGYWFANIVDRGYQTIVPPINHKVMEVSNVAFFPAYPALASLLRSVFRVEPETALLITAQLAAWGFWTYFFLFCERWRLSSTLRFFGALFFFVYCQWRWGRWDMYMLTQSAGWNIEPDYLAVFRPSNYRWLFPALNDPTQMSQMAMTFGALLLIAIAVVELLPSIRRRTELSTRIGIYFCAAVIYYISVSGVASLDMESMLRYEFCVHALIVLAFLHFLRQFRVPPPLLRVFGMAAAVLVSALGLSVQGWYVWNFTRGNWVA